MSSRSSRVSQEYSRLKKMLKDGQIHQLLPFDPKNKNIDHLAILLKGPKGTAFQGGLFRLEVKFSPDYPNKPPFVRLHTPIWHPNFWPKPQEYQGQRNICLALVDPSLVGKKGGWSPSKTITTVIQAIIAMFNTRGKFINPTDVFNKKAALEMMNDPKAYEKKVKHLVKKYANKKW
ncbi:MAG: ubiquitin-conjugating enzyme E2 [Candidatus Lokiarchaeota archaeon]|nr:ubiquitin-conjugating enzyme E2 [Candidatus Lokiarchaeota archaeon]